MGTRAPQTHLHLNWKQQDFFRVHDVYTKKMVKDLLWNSFHSEMALFYDK